MSSAEKQSVSSGRGGLQAESSGDVLRSAAGALGGLTKEALERATGSPEIKGNSIRLQFDGPVTFDAWMEAIAGAKRYVHFENYILRNDPVGRAFREVLLEKARQGSRYGSCMTGSGAGRHRGGTGGRFVGPESRCVPSTAPPSATHTACSKGITGSSWSWTERSPSPEGSASARSGLARAIPPRGGTPASRFGDRPCRRPVGLSAGSGT